MDGTKAQEEASLSSIHDTICGVHDFDAIQSDPTSESILPMARTVDSGQGWPLAIIRARDWITTNTAFHKLRAALAVFGKYARRVRSLKGPHVSGVATDIDNEWFLAFCSSSAPFPLLPNLRSLDWTTESDFQLLHLQWLVKRALSYKATAACDWLMLLPK
ncbi:hypothetical protein BJ138DRAFT_1105297 [Hygrophoropsis aurantiaca]|uniref:Uncharacterized protein n=1 Tax=Hygrophoropsis aurantiaca TaxID=72124 RepID=A0ACB7ZZX7_9AGAM|nr:hypothetical protein BJ138DRAFT_1105297 [Hygrophoropsis aurantiaca]